MAITSMVFDSSYYLTQNQDVLAAVVAGNFTSAESHWTLFGYKELRDPNASFDTSYYLQSNPDIVAAGVNALTHFMEFGAGEGRAPTAALANISATFDSTTYLAANADVDAAVTAGTFKNAYERYGGYIGKDLVGNPDLLNDPDNAAAATVKFLVIASKRKHPDLNDFTSQRDANIVFARANAGWGKPLTNSSVVRAISSTNKGSHHFV